MYIHRYYPYADRTSLNKVFLRKADSSKSVSVTWKRPQAQGLEVVVSMVSSLKFISFIPAVMLKNPTSTFTRWT